MFRPDSEIIALHLSSLRAAKRALGTISKRRHALNSVIRHIQPTPLLAAGYEELLGWQNTLAPYSPGHIANSVCHIQQFYRWCVKPMGLLDISPGADLVLPRVPRGKPRPVPEADYQAARIAATDMPQHPIGIWIDLARWGGCRCIEIANLGRDDVLLDDAPRLRLVGKGGKVRVVFVARSLAVDVLAWFNYSGTRRFTKTNGIPYTAHEVSNVGNDFLHELGLIYTMHQLRHTYGTRSVEKIGDARVVQVQMGHESLSTTQLYVEPNQPKALELSAIQDQQMRDLRRR